MTQSRRPISFVGTDDPDAASAFYGDVLGLELIEASPFALAFRDGETMLRVQIVSDLVPAGFTAHGWQVDDIEKHAAELQAKGVVFSQFEGLKQDASGIWMTPDGGKIAWFKDPSGNILSLTEFPGVAADQ